MNALRAAWAAVARHLGLVVTTYVIQVLVAAAASAGLSIALIAQFSTEPLFDRAVDGDLAALITVLKERPGMLLWAFALALIALAIYVVVSWFCTAGLLGAFVARRRGDDHGVRAFGALGAARFWSFARLWGWTLPLYIIVFILLIVGFGGAGQDALETFSGREFLHRTLRRAAPALIALWLIWTVAVVARVDLVQSERPAAWRSLLRAFKRVATTPRLLAITLAGHLLSLTVVMLGFWLGGVGGAFATVWVRQLLLFTRHGVHVGVLGAVVDGVSARGPKAPPG